MSYNGWTNWETWACNLHFGEDITDIFRESVEGNFSDGEDSIYADFEDRIQELVEDTVNAAVSNKPVEKFPPVAELFNLTDEIDWRDLFESEMADHKNLRFANVDGTPVFGWDDSELAENIAEELSGVLDSISDENGEINGKEPEDYIAGRLGEEEFAITDNDGNEYRIEIVHVFEQDGKPEEAPSAG